MAEVTLRNKKLNDLIWRAVVETIQEVLRDPDFGLELQEWVKKRLRKSPKNLIPLKDIKKKY